MTQSKQATFRSARRQRTHAGSEENTEGAKIYGVEERICGRSGAKEEHATKLRICVRPDEKRKRVGRTMKGEETASSRRHQLETNANEMRHQAAATDANEFLKSLDRDGKPRI